jgi:CDP-diacylglycerol---serine O-phosphatidyltransferase
VEIKKHIPNMLTLGNLLCGCLAIIEILQNKSIKTACIFMVIALIFDFFDGFLARLLKVNSPIGRELDSLADMVTFGILPAFIMQFIMLNYAHLSQNLAYLAFSIALFSGLRLAKFNIDTRQSDSFIGVPTPANAILIASIALNIELGSSNFFTELFSNPIASIATTLIMSYLLVAELPLFAFKFKNFGWKGNEIRFLFILATLALGLIFHIGAIPWIIVAYILISIILNFSKAK